MVPRIHAGGRSFGGVVAYLTHDARTPDDPRPTTGARVGGYVVENLPDCQPRAAAAIMRGTARDAAVLKELAGGSAKGRPLTKPVYHYSLSWAQDERPTQDTMLTAARSSLQALGMADRQAFIVRHTDRAHAHCHIVVNRVSPEDGRAASKTHDARVLSTWARTWERERGGVRCPRRPAAPGERAPSVAARVVEHLKHRADPAPPQPHRGPGRHDRQPTERKEWAALYARQRQAVHDQAHGRPLEKTSSAPQHRGERRELAQQHHTTREQMHVADTRRRYDSARGYERNNWGNLPQSSWQAAREVEPRLPHAGGVLAVSDRTIACLMQEKDLAEPERSVILTLYRQHRDDVPAREQAEDAYYGGVIDHQQTKAQRHESQEYRRGASHSPTTPRVSWNAVRVSERVMDFIVAHVRELVERTFREVAQLRERVTKEMHAPPQPPRPESRIYQAGDPNMPPPPKPIRLPERDREPTIDPRSRPDIDPDFGPSR